MILCLGAHPDDIELGAGATLSTLSGEDEVIGFTFTCQSAFQKILPEMLNSWEILGVKYLSYWDQGFKHRDLDRQQVLDTLLKLRDEFNPSSVYTHSSFDRHQDHKVIYEETVRAFKHTTILGYSLPWNEVNGSDYRYYEKLQPETVRRKLAALAEYKSQYERSYFSPEYQKSILMVNGQQCNSLYAEKFEVIRYVNN